MEKFKLLRALLVLIIFSACTEGPGATATRQDDLVGTWQCTRIDPDGSSSGEVALAANVFLAVEVDTGRQLHRFSGTEYTIVDREGTEMHRWHYKLDRTLLIVASDTAQVRWTTRDAFHLMTPGQVLHFNRTGTKDRGSPRTL
ncbi:MAG: hypothetical protein KBH07_11475 [Flavobacteriales bacterium]|nr:hypothetical protein [Flavobacteriales bacterium]MBP9079518.1 hypothetical protein [Flavobacteriales bacterium]